MFLRRFRLPVILLLTLALLALAGGYLFAKAQLEQINPPKSMMTLDLFKSAEDAVPPPENFTSTAGDGKVDLGWQAPNSPGINGFLVYRWVSGETPAIVARLPADATSWTDASVSNGVNYFYLVVSVGEDLAKSGVDAQVTATPTPPPPPPPAPEPEYYYEYEDSEYYPPPVVQEPAPPVPAPAPAPAPAPCPPAPGGG